MRFAQGNMENIKSATSFLLLFLFLAFCLFIYRRLLLRRYNSEQNALNHLSELDKRYKMRKNINYHIVGGFVRQARYGVWLLIFFGILVFFRIIFDSYFPKPVEGHPFENVKNN